MGLTENDFWQLTLKELDALFKRNNKVQKRKRKEAFYRSGIVASVIANCHRDPKKRKKAFKPEDFMPQDKKEKGQKQNWKSQLKMIKALNAAMGGTDKTKDRSRGGAE